MIHDYPELVPRGLHLHLGTGIKSPETYLTAVKEVVAFSKDLEKRFGVQIDLFDLGGGVSVRVIHTPGHTRGHCAFMIEPDGVLFLGDVDLTGFGPYYGDAWADLEAFERSLEQVRGIEAAHYVTGHHIGLLDDRDAFLARLDRYVDRIADREGRLREYLREPRTMDDIVAHRFVYRPHDEGAGIPKAERRSMELHLDRLQRAGRVEREGFTFRRR